MKYSIDLELFERYVSAIKAMEITRYDVAMYKAMDNFRKQIHDEILIQANASRDDKGFSFWLAERVAKAMNL